MGHHQCDVFMGIPIALEKFAGDFGHPPDSILKDLLSILMNAVHFLINCLVRWGMQRPAAGHIEICAAGTIDVVNEIENAFRSEEHTSELQSHLNLVCRLLLEKKKIHEKQILQT